MSWPRPIPILGDTTSAEERSSDPAGWAMDQATQSGLAAAIAARRDIRNYRPDAVPPEILTHILEAGHSAPSVGHSQPWRFIIVTDQAIRDHAALLADRERLRQANQLTPDRRARLLDLKLEGIRDAPVGVVIACDRRTPAGGVLGRATFPDTDMWSCACAIQNMWLTARAAGLGMGWVTFFQPDDLAELLQLPDGVETLGWMCLGWPDERPPEPGLQRRGWSRRLALEDVTLVDRWPDDDAPNQPVSHAAASSEPELRGPDQQEIVSGRDDGANRLTVPGSLGIIDSTVDRMVALSDRAPTSGTLILAAADHPVVRHHVSAYPPSTTHDVLAAAREGTSLGASTAAAAGLHIDVTLATTTEPGDLVNQDAMSHDDADYLIDQGRTLGAKSAANGLVCLGEVGIGNTTVAAAMACILLNLEPADAVGLGTDADSDMMERKRDIVARAVARARARHGTNLDNPRTALVALGGPEIALLAGVTIAAAQERVPVVLDGLVTSIAALLAVRQYPHVQAALVAGQRSREHAHAAVLTDLGLEPLLEARLRAGEGVGACLAAQLLITSTQARATTTTVQ